MVTRFRSKFHAIRLTAKQFKDLREYKRRCRGATVREQAHKTSVRVHHNVCDYVGDASSHDCHNNQQGARLSDALATEYPWTSIANFTKIDQLVIKKDFVSHV